MRRPVDADRLRRFMRSLGQRARHEGTCYVAGGATAVLEGWRDSTIDIDIKLVPEHEELLRALPDLKNELEINVELAWPGDFVPLPRRQPTDLPGRRRARGRRLTPDVLAGAA